MTTESPNVPAGVEARPPSPNGQLRTPAEIEAEIEATRQRLAGTVDAIADRVKPANVARRAAESAKAQFVNPDGSLRTTRVAAVAAGVAVVVGLTLWRRSR
jgi:hypothetical protein